MLGYATSFVTAIGLVGIQNLGQLDCPDLAPATTRAAAMSTFLTVSVIVPLGALALVWLTPLLGSEWTGGGDTVQLIALALIPSGLIGVLTAALTAHGATSRLLTIQIAVALAFLLGGVVFVALIGPLGAAAGYALSRWLYGLLLAVDGWRRVGVRPGRQTVLLLASGTASFIVLVVVTAIASPPPHSLRSLLGAAFGAWLGGARRRVMASSAPTLGRRCLCLWASALGHDARMPSEAVFTRPHAECTEPELWSAPDDASSEVEVSEFIAALVRLLKPRLIVEIGTFHGHTTAVLADAVRQNGRGHVMGIELDATAAAVAERRLEDRDLSEWAAVAIGSSLEWQPPGPIDFASSTPAAGVIAFAISFIVTARTPAGATRRGLGRARTRPQRSFTRM